MPLNTCACSPESRLVSCSTWRPSFPASAPAGGFPCAPSKEGVTAQDPCSGREEGAVTCPPCPQPWPRSICCAPLSRPQTTPLLSLPRALRAAPLPLPSGHYPAARPRYREGRHLRFYLCPVGPLHPTQCLANSRHSGHPPIKPALLGSRRQLSCCLLRGPASNFGGCGMKEMDWVFSLCTGTPQGALDRS